MITLTYKEGAQKKIAMSNARSRPGWERLEEIASKYNNEDCTILDVGIHGDVRPGGHFYMFDKATYETVDKDRWVQPTHIADIRDLPMDDETYDMIICHSVMEHVLEDRDKAYSELYRVLKKGGTLVYSIPMYLDNEVEPSSFVSPRQIKECYEGKDFTFEQVDRSYWVEVKK